MTEIADPSGRRIVLELSEHERIDDYDELGESLRALRPAFGLAVDDAGSGFASLRHVLTLGPDFMKLDQSWVKSIHEDQSRQALADVCRAPARTRGGGTAREARGVDPLRA